MILVSSDNIAVSDTVMLVLNNIQNDLINY